MQKKLEVVGAYKLKGQVKISGLKKMHLYQSLQQLFYLNKRIILRNLPRVRDIETMVDLLESLDPKLNSHGNSLISKQLKPI